MAGSSLRLEYDTASYNIHKYDKYFVQMLSDKKLSVMYFGNHDYHHLKTKDLIFPQWDEYFLSAMPKTVKNNVCYYDPKEIKQNMMYYNLNLRSRL
jgi:hypothetical protein